MVTETVIMHSYLIYSIFRPLKVTVTCSDFIAFLGIQPVPLEFGNKSQYNPPPNLGKYRPFLEWEAACIRL